MGCLLAGSTRRRPVLPSPAPPRRPAVRRPDPTGPKCVRVLDSTGALTQFTHHLPVESTCRVQNPDIPQAGRVGVHGGVAGRGRAGLGANRTVRLGDKLLSYQPKHRRHVA